MNSINTDMDYDSYCSRKTIVEQNIAPENVSVKNVKYIQ